MSGMSVLFSCNDSKNSLMLKTSESDEVFEDAIGCSLKTVQKVFER
jgi:hypothetical protein